MSIISKPLISVVVAVFNGAKTLQRCIDSFESQSYQRKELIVIDGGSTDGTVEILKGNDSKIVHWESLPDRGIYHAWNKALDHVKGEWIYFLGADDFFWENDVLIQVGSHLARAYPPCRIAYGQVAKVRPDGSPLYTVGQEWVKTQEKLKYKMVIPHQATFHHCSLFEKYGKFDETFRVVGDYDLLMRDLRSNDAYFVGDIIVAGMQHGGISSQPESTLLVIDELCKARSKNGLGGNSIFLLWRRWCAWLRIGVSKCLGEELAGVMADLYRMSCGKPRLWTRLRRKDPRT